MTGNKLFESAISLLGLLGENGDITSDTNDLKSRSLSLINIILAENSELDCRIRRTERTVKFIASLDEDLPTSEIVSQSVLPYGLAYMFALGEDDILANCLKTLYTDSQNAALKFGKAVSAPITEVYR